MVKSSGVEKGELFVGVQIRQLVLPFPLEAPLCVPLRLSPFTLLVSHFGTGRSLQAGLCARSVRKLACWLYLMMKLF